MVFGGPPIFEQSCHVKVVDDLISEHINSMALYSAGTDAANARCGWLMPIVNHYES